MGRPDESDQAMFPRTDDETEPTVAAALHYIAQITEDGTILALSGPAAGLSIEHFIGTKLHRWIAPVALKEFERALHDAFTHREARSFTWIGSESGRLFASRITPLFRDGAIANAVMTTHDVAERERERQALRESEQRFQALVKGAFEGLAITVGGTIVVANEALGRMLGTSAESLIGRSGYEFCAPESHAVAREAVRTGDETAYEVAGLRADGITRFPCELLGRNIVYLGKPARLTGFRDLTERHRMERERKEIEEQMRQAQKLESLGMLAGGIAHDFNNVLMAVLANAEAALAPDRIASAAAGDLSNIREAAMRGRELTRQLLNYAAQGPLTRAPVDLNELVRDTVALIGVSISKKAELSLHLADEPAMVDGDSGQLRQLIMNLVINASEALEDKVGQVAIHIATVRVIPSDLEGSALLPEIPSGRAVMLRVSDTGQGMSEETRKRIFEPFFSTKLTGRGLGLASVLNVVRGHRGAIRVDSRLGAGTELTVWLKQGELQSSGRVASSTAGLARAARGLVLVADDEPTLRRVARVCLRRLGFDVVLAEDGEDALRQYEQHAGELVLVLLDLTMPKLSGVEALQRIREQDLRLPVLCVSGYSAELVASKIGTDPAASFLAKPYSFEELASAIDGLLEV
jgi:two-component system cell cycle sensor histidine kinase/response regulator CckA